MSLVAVVGMDVGRGLLFAPVVEQQFLLCLRGELRVGAFDHGIHRAHFLAEAAVDGLGCLDVVGGLVAALGRASVPPEW